MNIHKYDVALSYASEDRRYVAKVANALRAAGVRVFYDRFESADIWGKNLYRHLSEVFKKEARYCVLFISKHFAKKRWTNKEVDAAFARALSEGEYILPARFDDTEIAGLEETTAYLDLQSITPEQLASLVVQKLSGTFTSRDVAQFYDLWHASVPTEAVVERIREKLQRAGGSPSAESIQYQARLSVALAEQYLKQRKVELGRESIEHAMRLAASDRNGDKSHVLRQVKLDCTWLSFIAMRFENKALACVVGCEAEVNTVTRALRKGCAEPARSQLMLHQLRMERSLITYYYVAGFLAAALDLADTLRRASNPHLDVSALAEVHLLPTEVMRRLLTYERFQLGRRILSAYLHVGDLTSALDCYADFCRSYLAVIETQAVDTLSLTTFHKLTGNLAALLSVGDETRRGRSLAELATSSFKISRLGALQQQLPSEYRHRGVFERVLAPTIDFEGFNASSRTKSDQTALVRAAQKAFARPKQGGGLRAAIDYPSERPHAIDRVAALMAGKNCLVTAAHASKPMSHPPDPGALRGLCEQLLILCGPFINKADFANRAAALVSEALAATGIETGPGLALILGIYRPANHEFVAVTFGDVTILCGNAFYVNEPGRTTVHRCTIQRDTVKVVLNSGKGSARKVVKSTAVRRNYARVTVGDR